MVPELFRSYNSVLRTMPSCPGLRVTILTSRSCSILNNKQLRYLLYYLLYVAGDRPNQGILMANKYSDVPRIAKQVVSFISLLSVLWALYIEG